jgi:hypothetical protein
MIAVKTAKRTVMCILLVVLELESTVSLDDLMTVGGTKTDDVMLSVFVKSNEPKRFDNSALYVVLLEVV